MRLFLPCGYGGQVQSGADAPQEREVVLASEFRYCDPIVGPGDLVIVISQSGETLDTMAALREAKSAAPGSFPS